MKSKRRKRTLIIIASIALVLILVGIGGWQLMMGYFMRQYYESEYKPTTLAADMIGDFPSEYHLTDVPWFSTELLTCQSNSLQIIAAQHGIQEPRNHFDFLMGFTYGATKLPGVGFSPYGTDPEMGLMVAAPYVGLEKQYYITDNADLYRRALRSFIAQGYPVRVALDFGTLYGLSEFIAHSDVLVGYDAQGFYYYETVCIDPAKCEAGEYAPGEDGLYVSDRILLEAVLGQSKPLKYPWRYALTIFTPAATVTDLKPVWTQNSVALLGGNQYGPQTGADAIEAIAEDIAQKGPKYDIESIAMGVEVAIRTRPDNATYLQQAFPEDAEMQRAAGLLDQAAEAYRAAQIALADGIADQAEADAIANEFRIAAAAERAVGEIFAAYGQ